VAFVSILREAYLRSPAALRREVGRLVPEPVKRAVRARVGPTPWSEAPADLERNPSWNSLPPEHWESRRDGADYNFRSQELLVEYLRRLAPGERLSLLDAACGNGRLYRRLEREGLRERFSYRGVDVTPNIVEAARRLHPEATWQEASVESLPFADGELDVAVAEHVIGYLGGYEAAVAELLRVARRAVLVTVKGIAEGEDRLGTYWNERHQRYFRSNLYEPGRLKAFARSQGAALAFLLNDARVDDPEGQYVFTFLR
jgi:SAM-dependent methyltransferase